MAAVPRIYYPGSVTDTVSLEMTTNMQHHFFTGVVDENTIEIQIRRDGGAWASDPALVGFDLPSFTVPNPSSYPNGYSLPFGLTVFQVRAIDINGSISGEATITLHRVADSDLSAVAVPPTGLSVNRHLHSVDLVCVENTEDVDVIGYNFYASVEAGGGSSGYYRINEELVQVPDFSDTEVVPVGDFDLTFVNSGLYLRAVLDQVDGLGTVIGTAGSGLVDMFSAGAGTVATVSVAEHRTSNYYKFTHQRGVNVLGTLNGDKFTWVDANDPLYYVVTAVSYSAAAGQLTESPYSSELVGCPLNLTGTVRHIPSRTRQEMALDYITSVLRVEERMNLNPGSTGRNIQINPFTSEVERLRLIADYVHRAGSFITLMELDDPNGDGTSDDVLTTPYKIALASALGIRDPTSLQDLINSAFDTLAVNVGKNREGARVARGTLLCYTTKAPDRNMVAAAGSIVATDSGLGFTVESTVTLDASNIGAYWNPTYRRYEITVNIVSQDGGSAYNVSAGQIRSVRSGLAGFSVTNTSSTQYGRDSESNRELAERCILAFSSVDSGTVGGYESTAISAPGVVQNKVVAAGDLFMLRDWDSIRGEHVGGKVDVWVKGTAEQELTEQFAFQFELALNTPFSVLDPVALVLEASDAHLSATNPISEILSDITLGYGFRNVTRGLDYNLIGAHLGDSGTYPLTWWKTVILDPTVAQPVTALDDVISGDYRYFGTNQFVPTVQPVVRVSSVIGANSGSLSLDDGHYDLYKLEDPMYSGESPHAHDYLKINQIGGVPTGVPIQMNDEQIVLVGELFEPLRNIGVNTYSIHVYTSDRISEYVLGSDYAVKAGSSGTLTYIKRLDSGGISDGESVSVDYQYDENFTVVYTTNRLLHDLSRRLETKRHCTADVLPKQAVAVAVNMDLTVVMRSGAKREVLDGPIRTSISAETNRKLIGKGLYQSDVAWAVESAHSDVIYCPIPFLRMVRADGTWMVRDRVASTSYVRLNALESGPAAVFVISDALSAAAMDGGGYASRHHGVFADEVQLVSAVSLADIGGAAGQSWIVGSAGAVINGYSDVATLTSAGFLSATEQAAELLRRTANHVLVSISAGPGGVIQDTPADHSYSATYVVLGASGAADIEVLPFQYVTLGTVNILYREEQATDDSGEL